MGSALSSTGFEEDDSRGRNESLDPILEKLRNLHVVTPILKPSTGDSTLTDLLLHRTPSQSAPEGLDPSTTAKLFALYQEWQRVTAANIAKNQVAIQEVKINSFNSISRNLMLAVVEHLGSNQLTLCFVLSEELGYKIIGVEELSVKLLQRLNYTGRVLESSAAHLKSVHTLQVEVAEMKRSLTETIGNYERLCHKMEDMGLHKNNIKPISISNQTQYGARAKTPLQEISVESSSKRS